MGSRSSGKAQGVAVASEACSPARATQAFRRCSPRIAPVTFRTLPEEHEAPLTQATSQGASIRGSDLRIVWAAHGKLTKHESTTADTKIRMSVVPPAR